MKAVVDLEAYGRPDATFEFEVTYPSRPDLPFEVEVTLRHGPRPEDWSWEMSPGLEEILDILEGPREPMPGGWVESDDDSGGDDGSEGDQDWNDDDSGDESGGDYDPKGEEGLDDDGADDGSTGEEDTRESDDDWVVKMVEEWIIWR